MFRKYCNYYLLCRKVLSYTSYAKLAIAVIRPIILKIGLLGYLLTSQLMVSQFADWSPKTSCITTNSESKSSKLQNFSWTFHRVDQSTNRPVHELTIPSLDWPRVSWEWQQLWLCCNVFCRFVPVNSDVCRRHVSVSGVLVERETRWTVPDSQRYRRTRQRNSCGWWEHWFDLSITGTVC